jgi:hypothetical protein
MMPILVPIEIEQLKITAISKFMIGLTIFSGFLGHLVMNIPFEEQQTGVDNAPSYHETIGYVSRAALWVV